MSLNRKNQPEPQKEPEQKVGYISREVLKKEAERIRRQSKAVYTSQQAEVQEIPQEEQPQDEMERISAMVRQLAQQSGVNSQEAQKDERVTLLAAATLEMCRILERFSRTISAEMKKTTEIELQNLDIQKQYAENVRISTVSIVRDIYYQFEGEQKKAFDKVTKYLSDTNDRMEKQIEVCTAQVQKATKNAVRSAERLRKLKTIGDILYFSAPILVLIDIIIRAVGLS